jgi:hypothetical protein
MIIHDFHLLRIATAPDEANPPLIINADAVLAGAVTFQGFQPITRRRKQIGQCPRPVQVFQLAPGGVLNVRRQLAGAFTPKDALRFDARKAGYHGSILSYRGNMSRRGLKWIAARLKMGTWKHLNRRLHDKEIKRKAKMP